MSGRVVEVSERHANDDFAWLDNGVPAQGATVTLKPAAKRGRRKGIRMLEFEERWPEYLEWLASGQSRLDYAQAVKTSLSTLYRWEKHAEGRTAEVSVALEQAADMMAARAEWVLRTCRLDKESIARAKHLADHYRWTAERFSERYGHRKEPGDSNEVIVIVRREKMPTAAEIKAQEAIDAKGS